MSAGNDDFADLKARVPLAELIDLPLRDGKARCPFHEDGTASLHIYPDNYHCFGCGAHGDHFEWSVKGEGLSFAAAVDQMRSLAGVSKPPPKVMGPPDPEQMQKLALGIWSEAKPIEGTLAARYLTQTRGLDITELPTGALRFLPNCIFGKGVRHPCLVALFRDVKTNAPTGIHRTALTAEALKIDRKSLGRKRGSAIKLWPDDEVTSGLVIGEGIETTLAAAQIKWKGTHLRPAWAMGDKENIASFPVLLGIEALTVLVDHDENGVGQRAAAECLQRWRGEGREAVALIPDTVNVDFNDLTRRQRA